MDADWDELRVAAHLGPLPNAPPVPVSVLAFDNSQELLWVGSQYGRLRSLYGSELQTYSSNVAHPNSDVRQIIFHEKGVISLSAHYVHMCLRTGPQMWHLSDANFLDLRCMCFTSKDSSELLVAGAQETMFKIDVERGEITEYLPAQDRFSMMKYTGQYVCAANCTGAVNVMDPVTLKVVKVWQAHMGVISDMDAKSDFLVTCGLSPRQQHGLMHDPLANVFDLKALSPLPPIPFQPGAAFVRMHPKMSTTSIVVSQTGQMQVVDIMNPHTVNLKQAHIYENNYVTGLDMAPSGEALVLSSSICQLHLWGSPARLKFADFPNPTPFPTDISLGVPTGSDLWDSNTPLNSIGMPYYRDQLLSQWPSMVSEAGRMQPKIDPDLQSLMKRGEVGFFAPNVKKLRPNQIIYPRMKSDAIKALVPPKFLSEKAREGTLEDDRGFKETMSSLRNVQLDNVSRKEIPYIYQNVEIKYSRFGVDDFDFEFYNKTPYSGLETHIANSYANPLLQMYRFIPIVRNLALLHTATSCLQADCMLCQLGFLVDMLEKAEGQNCQATNFLKTLSSLSIAASLNLLDDSVGGPRPALTNTIQSLNRFLLERFISDFRLVAPQVLYLEQALTTQMTTTIRCAHCNHEQMRTDNPYCLELQYPIKNMIRNQMRGMARLSFTQILKSSVEKQEQMRGYCPSCNRYQMLQSSRNIQSVPAVLMINTALISLDVKQMWSSPNWLPTEIGIIVDHGQVYCYEGQDLRLHLQRGVFSIQVYELVGVVCEISYAEGRKPHLVSMINTAPSARDPAAVDDWHIFNDFLVQPISQTDALRFDPSWKMPSVLTYQLKTLSHQIDDRWKDQLDTSLLHTRYPSRIEPSEELVLLAEEDLPKPGTQVGIDAEFVSLQSEEIEIKADGSRETVRPSRLGLARVSVLRGDGPQEDVPFIDDYIATSEPIVDYLTAFSGIRPGDLDPGLSEHPLVTLKMAYKKIWQLLNLGCIFVGHGLLKDFRTINIHVPRDQVIDTVDLWFIRARARKLNLRFLAWLLLHEDVQGGESHDSIEDARTALKLWRKYQEVKSQGKMEETLEWVYKRGRDVGFRAPSSQGHQRPGTIGSNGNNRLSGTDTTGRNTPEPGAAAIDRTHGWATGSGRAGVGTPVKKIAFGTERVGFGSPLR